MKSSIVTIIWRTLVILGCVALAFAGLIALSVWGGCQANGTCGFTLPILDRELRLDMAVSAVIGVGIIALGWRIRRMNCGPNGKLVKKVR
jgi:hypothetical protein